MPLLPQRLTRSTRYLSDSTGDNFPSQLRYDAYGNRSATSGADHPTDYLFAGQWGYQTEYQTGSEPGLGLQYLQQRYYDPVIGRFISPDPIGFLGGLNLYSYLENDPVNGVDPSGLQRQDEGAWAIPDDPRGVNPGSAAWLHGSGVVGGGLQTGAEVLGTFNLGANAALAVNDAGEGRRAQALARVIPGAKWLGRAGRWLKGCWRRAPRKGYISGDYAYLRQKAILARSTSVAGGSAAAEIRAAQFFKSQGHNVRFLQPDNVNPTADLLVDGVPWDVYSPITGNADRIIGELAHKHKQAVGIVLDLSRSSVTLEALGPILRRVQGAGGTNIQRIIIGGR